MSYEMKHFWSLLPTVFVAVCSVTAIADVRAQQAVSPLGNAEKANCQAVYAVAPDRKVVDCPAGKGYDFCFTRELTDQANLISGQLAYFSGSMKSIPHPHDPDTTVYAAVSTITTTDGILETEEHGLFNGKTLEFAGISTVTDGKGKLEGYSGKLMGIGYAKGKLLLAGTLCRE